jgi:hypothetical protein
VITWVITLLHILPLVALLVLVFLLDALDDFNQSWGLLFRGTLVTILLTASLLWLVPWRVRAEATMLQRLGFLVPISIIIAFWILQAL